MGEGIDEHRPHVVGTMEDLRVAESQGAKAAPGVRLVASEVHRLLGRGAVMAQAVGLDHEAEVGPEEVDPMRAELALRCRPGQAGLPHDREEPSLEPVRRPAERLRVQEPLQAADSRPLRLPVERPAKSMRPDQLEPIRLVDRVFQLVVGKAGRKVDEDRDRIADRDAVDIATPRTLAPMDRNPRTLPEDLNRDRDIDGSIGPPADPPELGGTPVTQLRSRNASEHGGHQLTVTVDVLSADQSPDVT